MASPSQTLNVRNTIAKSGGRPTRFQMTMLPQVRKAAKAGCTEPEIADILNINRSTFIEWCARYPKFSNALQLGKSQANKRVARALFHRSVGYEHDAVKLFNDKGNVIKGEYREHVPPDVNAIKFWLTNKAPDEWQDRSGLDLTGSVSVVAQTLSAARQRVLQAKTEPAVIEGDLDE